MVIGTNERVVCPWCGVEHTVKEWDDYSFDQCANREQRRKYFHLNLEKAWSKTDRHYYKCIECNRWSGGDQLRIVTDDPRLTRLGGSPLDIRIVDRVDTDENY